MPRRTIQPREYGRLDDGTQRRLPTLSVRWGARGAQDVQVGLSTPDEGGPGTGQHHLLDYWYGDHSEDIGRLLWDRILDRLHDRDIEVDVARGAILDPAVAAGVGRDVLNAVTGSSTNGDVSWWTDLDRGGCQDAIRWLRKARDDSYGRDE